MIDLVMWSKHGPTLDVLDRIDRVIPDSVVNRKILVIDRISNLREMTHRRYGWTLVVNNGTGISDAANTALELVSTDKFVSFEDDLLLAENWWPQIPQLLKGNVTIASGLRFASQPAGLAALQRYVAKKYIEEENLAAWLRSRRSSAFTLGKTLDNTIYITEKLRSIGGFPKLTTPVGTETALAYKVEEAGYEWAVDPLVQSIHLRRGLRQELHHQYWYASQLKEQMPTSRASIIYRFFLSPFSGFLVAVKTRQPSITYIHPLIRLYYMKGLLEGR